MKGKNRRVILFINPKKQNARKLGDMILKELNSLNIVADVFSSRGFTADRGYDAAISLGGDGTVLSAARAMSPLGVPVFPVNLGTFGFIAGIQPGEWQEVFYRWMNGEASYSSRLMLGITIESENGGIIRECCLNDVVFSSANIGRIINLRLSCGETGSRDFMKLGTYHSDGLIISTPTGSTAYSAAAGGPIVDPELEAMILNPICPFTLTLRPMVLPAGETLMVEVEKKQRIRVLITIDGQVTKKLKSGDKVFLKKAPYPCLLIASGRRGFYHALRTKLAWAGEPQSEKIAWSDSHD
jgi:NAD+ kinase